MIRFNILLDDAHSDSKIKEFMNDVAKFDSIIDELKNKLKELVGMPNFSFFYCFGKFQFLQKRQTSACYCKPKLNKVNTFNNTNVVINNDSVQTKYNILFTFEK